MIEINALPARQGDALWIRWGDPEAPHQMFIDMGTEPIGKRIRERFEKLEPSQRSFDLLVVTHIDADHIGGVLTATAEAGDLEGLKFNEIWFNGFDHLNGGSVVTAQEVEAQGGEQGARLSRWLRSQSWNKSFDYGPVRRNLDGSFRSVGLYDGLELTVLGPTQERLRKLTRKWAEEVEIAIQKGRIDLDVLSPGMESFGRWLGPPNLESEADLTTLANKDSPQDRAAANGTSIVLLLKYRGRSILLAGDAFSDDLVSAIEGVSPGTRLHLDLFKLPHHGSRSNVQRELVRAVDCKAWLVSTDGTTFNHPDPEAIARVIKYSNSPLLLFNQSSNCNECWGNKDWQDLFGYRAEYGDNEDGYTLRYEDGATNT